MLHINPICNFLHTFQVIHARLITTSQRLTRLAHSWARDVAALQRRRSARPINEDARAGSPAHSMQSTNTSEQNMPDLEDEPRIRYWTLNKVLCEVLLIYIADGRSKRGWKESW